MHLYMQQTTAGLPAPRYLRLLLEQDLFGGWELIREAGQVGGKSQLKRELFTDRAQAIDTFEKLRALHVKRGFAVSDDTRT
ncbi:WGR domain-containing protein [Xanthomonadaceae bacterium JHOS43]|nr:WGR domain-containing protein [Xanthomonadaceae bacterium JHOS43]MCX7562892.1 WGR domain-containing protein [Xanthomonadaceae bacterium XH05]